MPDSYDWEHEANSEGGSRAAKVPPGEHDLAVMKIIHDDKDGMPWTSKAGDPQMMLIYVDRESRECADFITLSKRAGWKLAALLSAMGHDMAEFTRRDMKPQDFAAPDVAEEWLQSQVFRARVGYVRRGGKEYAEVTPIRPEPKPAVASDIDDIPL